MVKAYGKYYRHGEHIQSKNEWKASEIRKKMVCLTNCHVESAVDMEDPVR